MVSLWYSELIEWFVTAELRSPREEQNWSRSRRGRAIGKHGNTIRYREIGERLPDKANIALICEELGTDKARAAFLRHVIEQLHAGPRVVSDLGKRNLFIVENAERTYLELRKWDPILLNGLLQTEAYHMKRLAEPLDATHYRLEGSSMVEFTSWRKSSRSISTAQSECVECRQSWRKSTRSANGSSMDCVEARNIATGFQVRDSKLGHDSPVFYLTASEFTGLLRVASRS